MTLKTRPSSRWIQTRLLYQACQLHFAAWRQSNDRTSHPAESHSKKKTTNHSWRKKGKESHPTFHSFSLRYNWCRSPQKFHDRSGTASSASDTEVGKGILLALSSLPETIYILVWGGHVDPAGTVGTWHCQPSSNMPCECAFLERLRPHNIFSAICGRQCRYISKQNIAVIWVFTTKTNLFSSYWLIGL